MAHKTKKSLMAGMYFWRKPAARKLAGLLRSGGTVAVRMRTAAAWIDSIAAKPWFSRLYLTFAFSLLVASTCWWAWLGARIHANNADQITPAYLYDSAAHLHTADVPAAHSFLIKWPLFYVLHLFSSLQSGLAVMTVLVVLTTVLALVYVLYRIDRRPVVLGTWLLLLASCLLMVPTVPAPGNLLPVNMAMLATRNIEYAVYMASIWLLVGYGNSRKYRNWRFCCGIVVLGLLIASDKLFISLTVGGALLALVAYAAAKGWKLTSFSVRWLLGSLGAVIVGAVITSLLSATHSTHVIGGSTGPYNFIGSFHGVLLGTAYAFVAMLSELGANPASRTTVLDEMPSQAVHGLFSLSGVAYAINLIVCICGLISAALLIRASLQHNKGHETKLDRGSRFGVALIWSLLAAIGSFIATDHYFAGDARYLAIALFGLFIALALLVRQRTIRPLVFVISGGGAVIGILLAMPNIVGNFYTNQSALAESSNRNSSVVRALSHHPGTLLVGDYWRVVPIKSAAQGNVSIMPLQSCTAPRNVLSRTDWNHDLNKTSFAYLLSLDGSLTDFPHCSLQQIVDAYGRPNASVVVAGSLANPKEILLFYDHGAHKSAPAQPIATGAASSITPAAINDYPYKVCTGPTIMNVVAHEDDDLLFMNPDVATDILEGHCVRTIYMTAGDGGHNSFYWLGRMQGSEAAYDLMMGSQTLWIERTIQINPHEFVTIANPRDNAKISLIYFYLPDGNLKGQGFADTGYQSLAKLDGGSLPQIQSIYGDSSYSKEQLVMALTGLMDVFHPTELRTQSNYAGTQFQDHSDHRAVGRLATSAYETYGKTEFEGKLQLPISYYLGYSGHDFPASLSQDSRELKEQIFMAYSEHDGAVCHNHIACTHDPAYGAYLSRQKTWPY